MGLREFEDVAGEAAGASGGFDEQEFAGAIELAPHFGELAGEETSEDGMDVDTGVVVAEAADFGLRIVAVDRVIEALAHVFGEGDGAEAADAFGEKGGERRHAEAAPVEFSFCRVRSEEHTSELQSRQYLVCRLLLEKKKNNDRRQRDIHCTHHTRYVSS